MIVWNSTNPSGIIADKAKEERQVHKSQHLAISFHIHVTLWVSHTSEHQNADIDPINNAHIRQPSIQAWIAHHAPQLHKSNI